MSEVEKMYYSCKKTFKLFGIAFLKLRIIPDDLTAKANLFKKQFRTKNILNQNLELKKKNKEGCNSDKCKTSA